MVDLTEKVVLVTGASSGIGKAAAVEFARKGASVVLAARRVEKLAELGDHILTFNENCIYVRTDVTSEEDVANLFDRAEEKFGRIDILINNAGRGLKSGLIDIT
ncbi:MAG: oxidoreductase, partial [Planctomycetota bacterium]